MVTKGVNKFLESGKDEYQGYIPYLTGQTSELTKYNSPKSQLNLERKKWVNILTFFFFPPDK